MVSVDYEVTMFDFGYGIQSSKAPLGMHVWQDDLTQFEDALVVGQAI